MFSLAFVERTLDFEFVRGFVDKGKYHESVVLDTFILKKGAME
jgi:hypothetical protein